MNCAGTHLTRLLRWLAGLAMLAMIHGAAQAEPAALDSAWRSWLHQTLVDMYTQPAARRERA